MWKLLKFIGALVKTIFWLALFLVLAAALVFYILKQDIPSPLVRRISDAVSNDDYLCRIGRASYSLKSGLHFYQVKVFQKRVATTALVSADEISIAFSIQPKLDLSERLRGVTIKNLNLPSLPPKHAKTAVPPEPLLPSTNVTQRTDETEFKLPTIAAFPLTLEKANVLGIQAERLTASVAMDGAQFSATQVFIQWPDKAFDMVINGYVTANFATRLVNGNVKGQAFPGNILPLLVALHSRSAIKQINFFSKIDRPVNAEATFTVNIDNSDFSLLLGLDVGPCAYRDVPMKYAKGTLEAYGTNIYTSVVIGPLQAESDTGPISGKLVYQDKTGGLDIDATANMDITELSMIIDLLRHGELDRVHCATPPTVTVKGLVAVDKKSSVVNDLNGQITIPSGSILNVPVKNMTCDLAVKGESALFQHLCGDSASGGKISGDVEFFFPGGATTSTLFTTRTTFSNVNLSDLSNVFHCTDTRAGLVSGNLSLVGHAGQRTIASLVGEGNARISDGVLNRTPLFAGFTDYLARNIPGVSSLVNQSTGSMDFTVENGVLRTDNLLIEGDLFSIKGTGSCNLEDETVDFLVRANILKEKTFAGRITHFVTLPFTRLLLEFKVFGPLEKTDWSYVNIVEKISGGLSDLSDGIKAPFQPSGKTAQPTPAP